MPSGKLFVNTFLSKILKYNFCTWMQIWVWTPCLPSRWSVTNPENVIRFFKSYLISVFKFYLSSFQTHEEIRVKKGWDMLVDNNKVLKQQKEAGNRFSEDDPFSYGSSHIGITQTNIFPLVKKTIKLNLWNEMIYSSK